jgi:FAD/FMN-containing dehydrogenase
MFRMPHSQGPESPIDPRDLAQLRSGFNGDLVLPSDTAYDEARKVWNGMVDKRPAIIAYCTGHHDVIQALEFARSSDLPLAVRAGGHNVAGSAVCDRGLVVDLSRMKELAVDPERRTADAQAGLKLGELDAATQAFGLATTMGINSDTGMAGLTLGGGFGKLGRKYGLACDNLISADVITADGRLVHASARDNPDLFWGIRGGGGNFGIVTAFEFRLHPVGPEILRAWLVYDWGHAGDALRSYGELAARAPDEVSADAVLVTGPSGERLFSVSLCYVGLLEQGARVLESLLEPLRRRAKPLEEQIAPIPYLEVQSAGDAVFPRGQRYYWKAQFVKEINEDAVGVLMERFAATPSRHSMFVFQQVGGAISRVPPGETAYVNRDAMFDAFPISIWESPRDDEANVAWARDLWAALRPFATGGVYVNSLGEEGEERVRAAYGDNYSRLAALKGEYDPTNLFRLNQNVKPTR